MKKEQEEFISLLRKNHPEYASIRYPQPVRLEQVQLKPNEVLIEYEVTEDNTLTWLIRRERLVKVVNVPLTREELTNLIKRYGAPLEDIAHYYQLLGFNPKFGNKLYEVLLKGLFASVRKDQDVIIVPDKIVGIFSFEGSVTRVPKEVKTVRGKYGSFPSGARYIGDDCQISYSQLATALTTVRSLEKERETRETLLALVDRFLIPLRQR